MRVVNICLLLVLAGSLRVGAQTVRSLEGVIDIHAHTLPDVVPRSIDAIELARLAKASGMRAIVLKAHYWSTAPEAMLVSKVVPGIEVFGGIALNLSVGGMNADAVEKMALTTGGSGRIVWLGSFDTETQVHYNKESRPSVAVSKNGTLLPETMAVISATARHHLVLSTGHNSPKEVLMILSEARRQGVEHLVVTHAMMAPIHMNIAEMQEAANMGAFIEFSYNGLIGPRKEYEATDYAKAIRAIGVQHCILSSDLGQPENPVHTTGLLAFFDGLARLGLSEQDIRQMSIVNPARLLGLVK